jgi:hypothetical protein
MATTTHIPIEVYLRSSYEPDAEYVDGEIERRPAGEYDHASWQQAFQKWFWQHEMEWNIRVRPESAGMRSGSFCGATPSPTSRGASSLI